jgi:glycerate kinase
MAQRTSIDTQETRRKFLGASIERLAVVYIGVTARTYTTWVKRGATAKNIERIDRALKDYAKKEAY